MTRTIHAVICFANGSVANVQKAGCKRDIYHYLTSQSFFYFSHVYRAPTLPFRYMLTDVCCRIMPGPRPPSKFRSWAGIYTQIFLVPIQTSNYDTALAVLYCLYINCSSIRPKHTSSHSFWSLLCIKTLCYVRGKLGVCGNCNEHSKVRLVVVVVVVWMLSPCTPSIKTWPTSTLLVKWANMCLTNTLLLIAPALD